MRDHRMRATMAVGVVVVGGSLLMTACGGSKSPSSGSSASKAKANSASSAMPTVRTAKVSGLGTVLVTSSGRTLYQFAPDKQKAVTCTGSCAKYWPPLDITHGKPVAGAGVKSSMLGTIKAPDGKTQVTYNHWPLYTYVGDSAAGQAKGEGVKLSGGLWLALKPSGQLAKKSHKSSSSSSSWG